MYEARRQRSSWARIKLSIVRKVYVLSPSFDEPLDFVLFCPFHFFQNQQVYIVFSYSIVNVLFLLKIIRSLVWDLLSLSSFPSNFSVTHFRFATSSILSPQFCLSTSFLKFIFEALVFKIKNTRLVFFVNLKSFSFHFSLDSVVISHSVTIK